MKHPTSTTPPILKPDSAESDVSTLQLEHVGKFSNYPLYKLPVTSDIARMYEKAAHGIQQDMSQVSSNFHISAHPSGKTYWYN
jgi:hypothetical protein